MVIDIKFFIVETKNKKTPTIRCTSCWWCFMAAITKHQPSHYGLHVEDESISSAIDAHK